MATGPAAPRSPTPGALPARRSHSPGAGRLTHPAMAARELRLRRPGPGASIAAPGGGVERAQVTMTKQSRAPAVSE